MKLLRWPASYNRRLAIHGLALAVLLAPLGSHAAPPESNTPSTELVGHAPSPPTGAGLRVAGWVLLAASLAGAIAVGAGCVWEASGGFSSVADPTPTTCVVLVVPATGLLTAIPMIVVGHRRGAAYKLRPVVSPSLQGVAFQLRF